MANKQDGRARGAGHWHQNETRIKHLCYCCNKFAPIKKLFGRGVVRYFCSPEHIIKAEAYDELEKRTKKVKTRCPSMAAWYFETAGGIT